MTRGGQTRSREAEAERKCVATGETAPKGGLIRFVADPEGQIVPDVLEKLPGRGIWVSANRSALETAVKKKLFARGAKAPVIVPDGLPDLVETLLLRRVTDLLAMARKSGDAVAGYEKVKDWLYKDRAEVLVQASDGSGRGKSKLSTPYGGSFIGWLTSNELGLAFGRETVIHAALGTGGASKRVVEEAARLKGLRLDDDERRQGPPERN
ncbi:RNA-binding protein [Pseudooceanicola aestuarii]|uniref:RNA-binding protein n=1 Tax=Pseudooceanicola aestuarii TaxID=2697319 RepID=UPI0013D06C84|nr:RNA-binding protein [Pseudooceanicola aestuarii]